MVGFGSSNQLHKPRVPCKPSPSYLTSPLSLRNSSLVPWPSLLSFRHTPLIGCLSPWGHRAGMTWASTLGITAPDNCCQDTISSFFRWQRSNTRELYSVRGNPPEVFGASSTASLMGSSLNPDLKSSSLSLRSIFSALLVPYHCWFLSVIPYNRGAWFSLHSREELDAHGQVQAK